MPRDSQSRDIGSLQRAWMEQHACGMSRRSDYTGNIVVIQVRKESSQHLVVMIYARLDCCLDVDWLDDWTFASCGADSQIYIMQVDGGETLKTLSYVNASSNDLILKFVLIRGHENEINEIRCNSTGTRLASCSDDMTARVWNIENLSSSSDSIPGLMASDVIVLRGHSHSVNTISWCPDHPPGTNQLVATYEP